MEASNCRWISVQEEHMPTQRRINIPVKNRPRGEKNISLSVEAESVADKVVLRTSQALADDAANSEWAMELLKLPWTINQAG